MKPTSLRRELTRASMTTTLVVLVLCTAALLAYELSTYRNSWVADLRTQGNLIAQSSAAAIVFNDEKAARENLQLLKLQPRVVAAAIYGKDGRLFASYSRTGNVSARLEVDPALAATGFRFDGSFLEVAYPIESDDESVGTVYLRAEHDIWPRVAAYGAILAAVMGAGLGIAFVVFNRQLSNLTRPLQQMTDVAQQAMKERSWNVRAQPSAYQDIGVLVGAFNGMLDEVQNRTTELEVEIAERVHAEQELRVADRKKDQYLATLAHELRNPLAPMTNALALAKRPDATAEVRDNALTILGRQLGYMVRFVDDLLDASRLTTGKLSLHNEPVDLVALLQSVVEVAESVARAKNISLTFEVPADSFTVNADPARLAQLFSNILTNACRYTEAGGRIRVALEALPSGIEVSVHDTGIGIEPAMQAQIFELFEQGDKSLERGNAGLGIGLTLARQLVQLHGGDIRVESAGRNRGAVFTVRLPGFSVPRVGVRVPASTAGAVAAAGGWVLLADDNVDFATSLADVLTTFGYSVQVVHDGAAALDAALQRAPDIALLDIGMPKLNGYAVAKGLRANPATRAIPLIAITGWGQPADKLAAEQAGFTRHLVKPVDPGDLIAMMTALAAA
ncbi:MAG: ATP-binding protein [Pseudomonadota bacterium]|nr:ATP-binding protein [Pseudomonadota bacterium]